MLVVKELDLSSNGRMSAWVRTPLLVEGYFKKSEFKTDRANVQKHIGCFLNNRRHLFFILVLRQNNFTIKI